MNSKMGRQQEGEKIAFTSRRLNSPRTRIRWHNCLFVKLSPLHAAAAFTPPTQVISDCLGIPPHALLRTPSFLPNPFHQSPKATFATRLVSADWRKNEHVAREDWRGMIFYDPSIGKAGAGFGQSPWINYVFMTATACRLPIEAALKNLALYHIKAGIAGTGGMLKCQQGDDFP